MVIGSISAAVFVLSAIAELLHWWRARKVATLAFGPTAKARAWTQLLPLIRVSALTILCWGLLTLWQLAPRINKPAEASEQDLHRILIVLDVSPSMHLVDAGPVGKQTRAKRASEVMLSVLDRVVLEQAKVSIVAFYTKARPVVIDTTDPSVIKNILNDLPLDQAFDHGQTTLFDGLEEGFKLAKPWRPESTTVFLISDGDTVPATGMPIAPPAIQKAIVLGVGDARSGRFIDGHTSRQDAATLRQVAGRLKGTYYDVNAKHLSSEVLADLSEAIPIHEPPQLGKRELALAAIAISAFAMALIPLATAIAGSDWRAGRQVAASMA